MKLAPLRVGMGAAARIAGLKGRIPRESRRHRRQILSATRRLESLTIRRFRAREPLTTIVRGLGVTQADPPRIPRGIDALDVLSSHRAAGGLDRVVILDGRDDDASPVTQRLAVYEELVPRKAERRPLLHGLARRLAAPPPEPSARRDAEYRNRSG